MQYEELAKKFGIRLKYYRNMRNLTQEQLSEKIGADVRYISDIERGKRNITFKTLSKSLTSFIPPQATPPAR